MAADLSLCSFGVRILLLAGVILGVVISEGVRWFWRSRKQMAYWRALRSEIEFTKGRAQMLIDDKVAAPLCRLPTLIFTTCFPDLLSEGALSETESHALMAFYAEVETLNRGLDKAAEANGLEEAMPEYNRNCVKARRLIEAGPLYIAAAMSIKPHVI